MNTELIDPGSLQEMLFKEFTGKFTANELSDSQKCFILRVPTATGWDLVVEIQFFSCCTVETFYRPGSNGEFVDLDTRGFEGQIDGFKFNFSLNCKIRSFAMGIVSCLIRLTGYNTFFSICQVSLTGRFFRPYPITECRYMFLQDIFSNG